MRPSSILLASRFVRWAVFFAGLFILCCALSDAQQVEYRSATDSPDAQSARMHMAIRSTGIGEVLHIIVGHSIVLQSAGAMRRVYIGNPAVLSSFTSAPTEVVVTAKSEGVSSLVLWDESGESCLYTVHADLDADALQQAIDDGYPGKGIHVVSREGRVYLTGVVPTPEMAEAIGKLAANYDKDVMNSLQVVPVHTKQVRLRVRFAEVDRSHITQLGINLFGILNPGGNQTLVNSTTGQFPSTAQVNAGGTPSSTGGTVQVSNALNFFLYDFQHQIGATIQDLEDRSLLHILAEPTIMSMSGQKASFIAGGEFPFPVVEGGGAASGVAVSIQFKQYGVKLDFTPVVNADGTIQLTVAPEVSALDYTNAVSINGYTVPALSTRRAQTQVELRDGETFAISGLLDQRTTDAFGRTPGIASIPILGELFKSKSINHSNTELMVIVTPEVVDPLGTHQPAQVQEPTSPVPLMSVPTFDDHITKPKP